MSPPRGRTSQNRAGGANSTVVRATQPTGPMHVNLSSNRGSNPGPIRSWVVENEAACGAIGWEWFSGPPASIRVFSDRPGIPGISGTAAR
jgi:hypothetical protein